MSSDHFDGKRFFNPGAPQARGGLDLLRWMATRKQGKWRKWTENEPQPAPPQRVRQGEARVTFIGHSTVLLQLEGVNVLIDPVWSLRASPVRWAGPRRRRPPGIAFKDLPPIDVVLLSHNHYDHCDTATLRRLAAEHRPVLIAPLKLRPFLMAFGFSEVHELDWWDSRNVGPLQLTSLPAQHFSARNAFDRNQTLWCGYEVRCPEFAAHFLGDTGFGKHLEEIAARCPRPDLAMIPIGAYSPEWFMGPVHITPEQAVEAHHILGARESMAIHFGTFPLADDGEFDPVRRLGRELERRNDGTRFWWLQPGEARVIRPIE